MLERAEHEAARIIDVARVRAERMVERTEVVREARRAAEDTDRPGRPRSPPRCGSRPRTTSTASSPRFEVVLDRTMQQVAKGRERLSVHAPTHEDLLGPEADEAEQAFFDQDESRNPCSAPRASLTTRVWVCDAARSGLRFRGFGRLGTSQKMP